MGLVFSGNKNLLELVELVVAKQYGNDAIAKPTVYDMGEGEESWVEVERAGKRILYTVDIERWESAREHIREASHAGMLVSYVANSSGEEKRLTKDGWEKETVWRTLLTGKNEHEIELGFDKQTIYFRDSNAKNFISRITTNASDDGYKHELFLKGLRIFCENDIEINIQRQGRKSKTYTPDSLGFNSSNTIEWKNLIGLLKSNEGVVTYHKSEGSKKLVWIRIEKKLIAFLEKEFNLNISKKIKLFVPAPGRNGVRKPLFKILKGSNKKLIDSSNFNEAQIREKIRELAISPNAESADSLVMLCDKAKELGLTEDDLSELLRTKDFLESDIADLEPKDCLVQDRSDIQGKRLLPKKIQE